MTAVGRHLRIAGAATLLLFAATASAQPGPFTRGFDAVPNKVTPTQKGAFTVEGATPARLHGLRMALFADATFGVLSLYDGKTKTGELIPFRTDLRLLASYLLLP